MNLINQKIEFLLFDLFLLLLLMFKTEGFTDNKSSAYNFLI